MYCADSQDRIFSIFYNTTVKQKVPVTLGAVIIFLDGPVCPGDPDAHCEHGHDCYSHFSVYFYIYLSHLDNLLFLEAERINRYVPMSYSFLNPKYFSIETKQLIEAL